MDLQINRNQPLIMFVDLNSCFATVEQQANPLLRGKPVCVAPYTGLSGCVISPSIEAKRYGVKTGMRVRDAKMLCPNAIFLTPDPPKYRSVHLQFKKIFQDYSPDVIPKSIDEAVIDFTSVVGLHKRSLVEIGKEIKKRMRIEIGEWISCSIGIGTNRFLAKTGANLHKPDGLDVVTHENLREVYGRMSLLDICGINVRYQARLNAYGIFTPLEFLDASLFTLQKQVFKSIEGYYWYLRLRGWKIDEVDFKRKTYGQSYALHEFTNSPRELSRLLMKLTEKMGRRLRKAGYTAQGIYVSCLYMDGTYWHMGRKMHNRMYTTSDLFKKAQLILNQQPEWKKVTHLAVSCYDLAKANVDQLNLFDMGEQKKMDLSNAMDAMNDRYGEYIITPALMMGMRDQIVDRVAFGGVKDLEEIYKL